MPRLQLKWATTFHVDETWSAIARAELKRGSESVANGKADQCADRSVSNCSFGHLGLPLRNRSTAVDELQLPAGFDGARADSPHLPHRIRSVPPELQEEAGRYGPCPPQTAHAVNEHIESRAQACPERLSRVSQPLRNSRQAPRNRELEGDTSRCDGHKPPPPIAALAAAQAPGSRRRVTTAAAFHASTTSRSRRRSRLHGPVRPPRWILPGHNVRPTLPPPGIAWTSAIRRGSDVLVLIDQRVRILLNRRQGVSDFARFSGALPVMSLVRDRRRRELPPRRHERPPLLF